MGDNRKKLRECPLAVLASTVKPHRVSPHIVQGPGDSWKHLVMCLDVAVQWPYHQLVRVCLCARFHGDCEWCPWGQMALRPEDTARRMESQVLELLASRVSWVRGVGDLHLSF